MRFIWNVPNTLSIIRIILTPFFVVSLFLTSNVPFLVSFFIVIALTDFFDGFLARRLGQETEIGRILDPTADRIFLISSIAAISILFYPKLLFLFTREIVAIPGWLFVVLNGKAPIKVTFLGKVMTALQSIVIASFLIGFDVTYFLIMITAFYGIVSGTDYTVKAFNR